VVKLEAQITELRGQNEILALPAALGKLAKDWKVETQKDHFPHYFTWILSKLPLIMKLKYQIFK
jgi:hypothetical protein